MMPPYQYLSIRLPTRTSATSKRVTIPNRLPPPFKARERSEYWLVDVAVIRLPLVSTTSMAVMPSVDQPFSGAR